MRFETACFHPNVDQHGNICLDILKEKWSAAYSVRTVLLSIQSLLGEPNNDSPLNAYAAKVRFWHPLNPSENATESWTALLFIQSLLGGLTVTPLGTPSAAKKR